MVGFLLDDKGDIVIEDNKVKTIKDKELIAQTVRQILMTNNGEWEYNEEEGIDFRSLLVKNPNYDQIRDNILLGLTQVDETFELLTFEHELKDRKLTIKFTAVNSAGEEIEVEL